MEFTEGIHKEFRMYSISTSGRLFKMDSQQVFQKSSQQVFKKNSKQVFQKNSQQVFQKNSQKVLPAKPFIAILFMALP